MALLAQQHATNFHLRISHFDLCKQEGNCKQLLRTSQPFLQAVTTYTYPIRLQHSLLILLHFCRSLNTYCSNASMQFGSSSSPIALCDTHESVRALEPLRTESSKIAAEVFRVSEQLKSVPTNHAFHSRLQILRRSQQEILNMFNAQSSSIQPIIITGCELGSSDVPAQLAKAVREERARVEEVKELSRRGEERNARTVAKDVVRIRKVRDRMFVLDANNKFNTVKDLLEEVAKRIQGLQSMKATAEGAKYGDDRFVDVLRYCSQLASDLLLIDLYEKDVERQVRMVAKEEQLEGARMYAKALVGLRKCRAEVGKGVEALAKRAGDEALEVAIKYMHAIDVNTR